MKVLVITICTGNKKHEHSNRLMPEDFASCERLKRRSRELKAYETPAAEMYTGSGHRHLMNGVKNLRRACEVRIIVDLRIISPGYGLLKEEDLIVPYTYTFYGLSQEAIRQRSRELGIRPKVKGLLSNYDLAFFLLSKDYVTACELPFHVSNSATQIFLVAPSLKHTIPVDKPYIHAVCAGEELVDQLAGANNRNLKGVVFERLCRKISTAACDCGIRVLEEVKQNPQRIKEFIL